MLVAMLSSFVLTKRRKAIQVFPESWKKLWNFCEIRITISLSLILQIILILLGNRRKVSADNKLRIMLWLAYNTADSVATVSLSVLSSFPGPADLNKEIEDSTDQPSFSMIALWVPFLLLHLGGPDTITAYSLEDNELWLRRLLQFGVQTLAATYVILNVWTNDAVDFMAIPMFFAGIIKCGERIWVLWHVSRDHFRNSLLTPADPGPNYARIMREYKSRKDEGFDVSLENLITVSTEEHGSDTAQNDVLRNMDVLCHANKFFGIFKRLFADLILSFDDIQNSKSFFRKSTSDVAFKVIEVELGLTYDLFYTKAMLVHSLVGVLLRFITFSCTFSVFCAFLVIKKKGYSKSDVIITYVLLAGASVLEILAVYSLLSSDWAMQRLGSLDIKADRLLQKRCLNFIPKLYGANGSYNSQSEDFLQRRKRWSNSMAQYNLIKICLKDHRSHKYRRPIQDMSIYKLFEMHWYKETVHIPFELKNLIFQEFQKKLVNDRKDSKQFCACKGNWVLEKEKCLDKLKWSVTEAEFDQSILLWHIATDLCYCEDFNREPNSIDDNNNNLSHSNASILLSNYMMYILVLCPFMLPSGIGQIRWRDTCAEATEFFEEVGPVPNWKEACTMLHKVCTEIAPSKVKGDRCKSVLFDGCRLAKDLNSLEIEPNWNKAKKWELISRVWIEMLSYAASQCKWTDHAQQLRRGGELLTHVWLLMAHLGITEQFQVSQGHARAKLTIE